MKLQKIYNSIIIGGGASGLLCAVELLSGDNHFKGEDVLILERNDRVGKKLIATGNGQGNLMNQNFGANFYYGDKAFIDQFIELEKQINLKKYLADLGIYQTSGSDGKTYPLSKQASAVLDLLRAFLAYKNCQILTSKKVDKISKNNDLFEVYVGTEKYLAKTVVVSAGGSAGKHFGTDGSAYSLVEKFGHKKTALYPSLVQLKTQTNQIKGLKGLKERAKVSSYSKDKLLMTAEGDLLFTDYGVSGSAIFSLSASVADKEGAYLIVEFLPNLSRSQVEDIIRERQSKPYISQEELLSSVLNKKIGQQVLKSAKSTKPSDIAYAIKNFRLNVLGSLDFSYAQVTRGGIKTDKIDAKTYQSKIVKGLYMVGEILDVDGDCGGYNLTFAFVSGIVSAKSIKGE
ncbi:MAG: aminoacetone oxidase family FAD-binding enzyme [Clostridiales bacterium]|nr:aminoacetone oxidase family FAD-binding enzyme [Clostridiales bacterium]